MSDSHTLISSQTLRSGGLKSYTHQGMKIFILHLKLKHIKRKLKEWNKNEFGNIFKAKEEVEKKLQDINQILMSKGFTEERKELVNSLQQEWDKRCY